jgi:hypothetical protein
MEVFMKTDYELEVERFKCTLDIIPGNFMNIVERYQKRDQSIKDYSFAILTEYAIKKIVPFSPIIEVGAGTGYWAYEFQKRGIDYFPTDNFAGHWFKESKLWTTVINLDGVEAARNYPEKSLLFCWPYMEE